MKKKEPPIWTMLLIMMSLGWFGYFSNNAPDWWGISLAIATGASLAGWAIEITGNKVPDFMAPKRDRRPPNQR